MKLPSLSYVRSMNSGKTSDLESRSAGGLLWTCPLYNSGSMIANEPKKANAAFILCGQGPGMEVGVRSQGGGRLHPVGPRQTACVAANGLQERVAASPSFGMRLSPVFPCEIPLSYGAFNTFGLAGKNLFSGENSRCYGTLDPLYSLRCAFHRDKGGSHGRVS